MKKIVLFLSFYIPSLIFAQSVGIGTSTFTPSAMLEIRGTGTSNATSALIVTNSTPTTMLTILNNGTLNVPTTTSGGMGVFSMNSSRFIHAYGTEGFFAGVNAGNFTHSGEGVTGVGYSALAALTSGWYNTAFGANAIGTGAPGHRNTAVGYNALKPNTQAANVSIGAHSMQANTGGDANTVVGTYAYQTSTSGTENVAVGYSSIASGNTTGDYNTMVGTYTGEDLTSGAYNVGLGGYSMLNTTSGSHNVGIGGYALSTMTGGDGNVAVGRSAMGSGALGSYNVALGYEAGKVNTGSRNVFIGYLAGDAETGSDKFYLSSNNKPLIIGDFSSQYVSIGTTTVSYPLYIKHTTNETVVVESNNTTSTAISVKNTSAGGHDFQFYSTGSGNTAGRFGIWDNTASKTWLNLSGTTGDYTIVSGAVYGFSSSATQAGTAADAGISRTAAGSIAIGNGTAADYSGKLFAGNVGIGTNVSANRLDVEGGAAIGATYSGTSAAPTNGLLVEGNVGIGTTSPATNTQLHVYGGAVTGGTNANLSVGSSMGTANLLGTYVSAASTGFAQFVANATYSGSAWSTVNSSYDQWATSMSTTTTSGGGFFIYHSVPGATPSWTTYLKVNASDGNVGIGSSTPAQKLDVTGNGAFSGNITAGGNATITGDVTISGGELNGSISTQWIQSQIDGGYNVGTAALRYAGIHSVGFYGTYNAGPDVAEMYPSVKELEPGTLASWDEHNDMNIRESHANDVFSIAGVVSSNPGVKLSDLTGYDSTGYPLALCGRVPVKISVENGVVKPGDPLTASRKFPGMAMKATEPCRIIGTALEHFDGTLKESEHVYKHMIKPNTKPAPFEPRPSVDGTGKIMMFVKVEWFSPDSFMKKQSSN